MVACRNYTLLTMKLLLGSSAAAVNAHAGRRTLSVMQAGCAKAAAWGGDSWGLKEHCI